MLFKISGAHAEAAVWLDRALGSGTGREPWYDAARCARSFAFVLNGDVGRALGLFGDLPARSAMASPARTDALAFRGVARLWAGDLHAAAEDLALAVNRIGAGVQVRFPCRALAFLAETEFRLGRWDDCRGHAEMAVALACDADRAYDLALVHSAAVPVAACRGNWAAADSHAQAAERAARTFGGFAAVLAASARGMLGLARDDPEEVLRGTALALAVPQIDRYDPAAFWWRPAQVWALIRTGRLGQAEAILAAIEACAARRGERAALTRAAWLRGSLAMARDDLDQAGDVLRTACGASRDQPLPFHHGLLELQHGRCLSRLQRPRDAVDAVRAACDVFSFLGAHPFLRASQAELAGIGLRPRSGGEGALTGLTSQELRVAQLVASGLSNRETAAQLYLSPKTVEYHLAHAFTKLGVRSRHQLTTRMRENLGSPA
jgi:DNA-binding CsgD family transcriptional regulator